jgi:aminotransferase
MENIFDKLVLVYMKKINKFTKAINKSGIRYISDLANSINDVVNLTVGEIDLPTPENSKLSGIKAINNNYTKYTSNSGTHSLRREISKFGKKIYGIDYDYKKEIIVTAGASEGLDISLRALCNIGDEILIPSPSYPAYDNLSVIGGFIPVLIDTSKNDFKLTADLLEEHISKSTKVVILNYPNNPTGTILSVKTLKEIADVIKKHDLYVISDDVYNLLVYGGLKKAPSIVSIPGMKERTIVLNSFSKSFGMTGWRIGYTLGEKKIIQQMLKIHQNSMISAPSISQSVATTALIKDIQTPFKFSRILEKRLKYLETILSEMNINYVIPQGSFYIFINIKKYGMSSYNFSIWLLKKYKLAVVPGTAFSKNGEGYIRMSFAVDLYTLKKALMRLKKALDSLKFVEE